MDSEKFNQIAAKKWVTISFEMAEYEPKPFVANLDGLNEQPVRQFQGQQPVDLSRIIAVSTQMPIDNPFHSGRSEIGPGQRTFVEKHLAHVIMEVVSIPDAEMERFVTAEPDTF